MKAQLQFKFKNFQENLAETFIKLLNCKELCDARLIGEDQIPIEAHRIVLSAFSSILKGFVKQLGDGENEIVIQGMDHEDIESLLQFLYLGEVSIAHAGVDKFLRAAKFLGINQVRDQCKVDIEDLNREFGVHLRRRVIENDETSGTDKNCTTDNNIVEDQDIGEQEYSVRSSEDCEEDHEKMVKVKQKEYIEAKIRMNLRTNRTISESLTTQSEDELVDSILKEDFTIGEPDTGFDISKSVLYTHKYFKKISKARAMCLICLKSSEKKWHFLKIIDSNTSGKKDND